MEFSIKSGSPEKQRSACIVVGVFEPRKLTVGARSGEMVEVKSGLTEGERIVTSGNFLIDAESNLQTALKTFGSKP